MFSRRLLKTDLKNFLPAIRQDYLRPKGMIGLIEKRRHQRTAPPSSIFSSFIF